MKKPTVYVALSMTHVRTEDERNEVRALLPWIERTFEITLLRWAFNIQTWTPEPVDDIYEFDTQMVLSADLVIVLYLTNDGSDGRGGEVVNRVERSGKPVIAFRKQHVKVSRYASDCLKKVGTEILPFETFEDMRLSISSALSALS